MHIFLLAPFQINAFSDYPELGIGGLRHGHGRKMLFENLKEKETDRGELVTSVFPF